MPSMAVDTRVKLSNILYLTDFSEASDAAVSFAAAIAREFGSKIYALHILLPDPYASLTPECVGVVHEGMVQAANAKMQQLGARLVDLRHETLVEPDIAVWPTLRRIMTDNHIDLIVLGTHGRTGIRKFLVGSVAEEVLRRSTVPVLTVGPCVICGTLEAARFHSVLFATDFTSASEAAAPYAISMAQENQARLILLHVIRRLKKKQDLVSELSVADAMCKLQDTIPKDAEFRDRPEPVVDYGDPPERILAAAVRRRADLIVLGIRRTDHLGMATHLERTTVHQVVANATCPVLTVRGEGM
jgi:nucleotide-binding universal stress UspA family protein